MGEAVIDISVLSDTELISRIPKDIDTLLIHDTLFEQIKKESYAATPLARVTLHVLKELGLQYNIRYVSGGNDVLSYSDQALLLTADPIQYSLARRRNINAFYLDELSPDFILEEYFDEDTLSVHIKENSKVLAKIGTPQSFKQHELTAKELNYSDMQRIIRKLNAYALRHGTLEHKHKHSTILQVHDFRITITAPPLSKHWEITAVKPTAHRSLASYSISEEVKQRLLNRAEGVIVAGSPGMGKSTFAQSVLDAYTKQGKIVKTIESPRDLRPHPSVSQYSLHHADTRELHDILLLSRPDQVVFDEMRTTKDFALFTDLRLSGIGLLGVMHASSPIDAVQRFLHRLELGLLPHVLDTLVFVDKGEVAQVLQLSLVVKVPEGLASDDLARPVVVISDAHQPLYEMYTFGDQIVTVALGEEKSSPIEKLAKREVMRLIAPVTTKAQIRFTSSGHMILSVQRGIKEELDLEDLESKIGLKISVEEMGKPKVVAVKDIPYKLSGTEQALIFELHDMPEVLTQVFVGDEFLMSAKSSKKSLIKVRLDSVLGEKLTNAIKQKVAINLRIPE